MAVAIQGARALGKRPRRHAVQTGADHARGGPELDRVSQAGGLFDPIAPCPRIFCNYTHEGCPMRSSYAFIHLFLIAAMGMAALSLSVSV